MSASAEELDGMSWKRSSCTPSGWLGALSAYRPIHNVNIDPAEEGDPRVLNRPRFKMLEITDVALFCKTPHSEPPDLDREESWSFAVRSQLQLGIELTSGSTPCPELDIAMIRAMLGSVQILSFRPMEHLEKYINKMFTDLKIPLHTTKLILPRKSCCPVYLLKSRFATSFPFRWFSNDDRELLAALRDVDGQLVSSVWSKADCMLVKIDPATEEVARPVEIVAFITLKSPDYLDLAGQAEGACCREKGGG
ncbi:hypothetical protein DFS33DRAFT_1388223 [Desarmillaria ectypa]|nr:hypothetical protein DFS33DRAFT_1388223 [Desarmillaria ectypa]